MEAEIPFCCMPPHYLVLKYISTNDTLDIPSYVYEICDDERYYGYPHNMNDSVSYLDKDNLSLKGDLESAWFRIMLCFICLFGVIANVLNLFVLASRRITSRLDEVSRSVNQGLMALAVSDLLFCMVVLPHSFVQTADNSPFLTEEDVYIYYYHIYGLALINVFQMTSIWLVVIMSVARYFGVADPLHARNYFYTRHMLFVILVVFLFSFCMTMPMFVYKKIAPCKGYTNILYYLTSSFQHERVEHIFGVYIRWIWPVVASFVPIVLLIICNFWLVRELNNIVRARRTISRAGEIRQTNYVVTITLISIVVLSLTLVAPPEILRYVNPYDKWGAMGHVIAKIVNLLQTLNFAVNFVLYCIVNVHFRKTIEKFIYTLFMCANSKYNYNSTALSHNERQFSQKTTTSSLRNSLRIDADQDLICPKHCLRHDSFL